MSTTMSELITALSDAGMSPEEATVYAELTQGPTTHVKLSRATGINRTKIYRIVSDLEAQGLVMRRTNDRGTFLAAGDPVVLADRITSDEAAIVERRAAFDEAKALLALIPSREEHEFAMHSYEGVDGMKQMHWHELTCNGVLRAFGLVTFEELVNSRRWAEEFRSRVAEAGYETRELISRLPREPTSPFTDNRVYMQRYTARRLSETVLPVIQAPMVIYNDTVAIYQVERRRQFGIEIIHRGFARTLASMFDHYWDMADPQPSPDESISPDAR